MVTRAVAVPSTPPLTGAITKTLAPTGGDFATIVEFNAWLHANAFMGADITLNVSAGTYSMGDDGDVGIRLARGMGINSLTIAGASEATTIFEHDASDDYAWIETTGVDLFVDDCTLKLVTGDPYLVEVYNNAKFFPNQVTTVDASWPFYLENGANIRTNYVTFNAPSGGFEADASMIDAHQASYVHLRRVTVNGDTLGAGNGANVCLIGSFSCCYVDISNTINDIDLMAYVENGGRVSIGSAPTLNNVTSLANVTVNEIQGDGSYVTNGGPLTLAT